jgi:hypothetical protein
VSNNTCCSIANRLRLNSLLCVIAGIQRVQRTLLQQPAARNRQPAAHGRQPRQGVNLKKKKLIFFVIGAEVQ